MAKTQEECKVLSTKLQELTDEELEEVAGGVDFTNLAIDIPNFFGTGDHAHIAYGNFIQNVVQFFIIAFAVFLMIRTVNNARRKSDENRAKLAAKAEELKAKAAAYKEEKAAKKKK